MMHSYYVSMTRDLLGVFIEYKADSKNAVEFYLEKHYLTLTGVWTLPWCAVYTEAPPNAIIVQAQCGQLWEQDYR